MSKVIQNDSEKDRVRLRETQIERNPAFNWKSQSKREKVQVSDLQKKRRKMKPGRKRRYDRSVRDKGERGGGGGRGAGRQYVRLCYYSLRVGWRHEKEEEEDEERGGGAADRKRARRLILQFSYITAPPPSLHLHPSLRHQTPHPLVSSLPPSRLPDLSTNETGDSGSFTEIDLE